MKNYIKISKIGKTASYTKLKCDYCNKFYEVQVWHFKKYEHHFCSNSCHHKFRTKEKIRKFNKLNSKYHKQKCTKCKKIKLLKHFYIFNKYYYRKQCKICINKANAEYNNKYRKEHYSPEKTKWYIKFRKYGLTKLTYNNLLKKQKNRCAICNKKFNKKIKICVDHKKNTKIVRGLLCDLCNRGLGHFKDNAYLILIAYKYLKG